MAKELVLLSENQYRLKWMWQHYSDTPICLSCKYLQGHRESLETNGFCPCSPTCSCSNFAEASSGQEILNREAVNKLVGKEKYP